MGSFVEHIKEKAKQGKKTNVAKTAIARELACFLWGMMTGHIV